MTAPGHNGPERRSKSREAIGRVPKALPPTGIASVDTLPGNRSCTLQDYLKAVSEYVRSHRSLNPQQKKAAQIRLSGGLGIALVNELRSRLPQMGDAIAGETAVSGALRIAKADVSEMDRLDGLRLAVEIKPVNLAVGRAIWNRFGDIRTFAVNLHLKFPFSVIGGVLVIPVYEEKLNKKTSSYEKKSTVHLIQRAIKRLVRAGGRRTEGDAAHLLESVGVIVYDPDDGLLHTEIPAAGTGLRWTEFIESMVTAYDSRFVSDEERVAEADSAPDPDVAEVDDNSDSEGLESD